MAYTVIENFNLGLRRAKSALTSLVGSLWQADDVHVTEGGEIQKRKAFDAVGFIVPGESIRTYGMCATSSTIYVFGSDAPAAMVTGVTYVKLRHPAVIDGEAYDTDKHRVTAVVQAIAYNNKPWVVATFSDGATYCYYDTETVGGDLCGKLVKAFRNGKVLSGMETVGEVTNHVDDICELIDGVTVSHMDYTGYSIVDVLADVGGTLDIQVSTNSAAGTISAARVDEGSESTVGTEGVGSFQVYYGKSTGSYPGKFKKLRVIGGSTVTLYDDATGIGWAGSATATATAIAAAINTYILANTLTGWSVSTTDSVIFIKYGLGDDFNAAVVECTVSGEMIVESCGISFAGAAGSVNQISDGSNNLMSGAVSFTTDIATTIAAVSDNINANAGSNYVASANSNVLYICKKVAASTDTATLTPTLTTITHTDNPPTGSSSAKGLSATLQYTSVQYTYDAGIGEFLEESTRSPKQIKLSISGGTQPYTGNWVLLQGPNASVGWKKNAPGSSWREPIFDFISTPVGMVSGKTYTYVFRLEINDSSAQVKTAVVTLNVKVAVVTSAIGSG